MTIKLTWIGLKRNINSELLLWKYIDIILNLKCVTWIIKIVYLFKPVNRKKACIPANTQPHDIAETIRCCMFSGIYKMDIL